MTEKSSTAETPSWSASEEEPAGRSKTRWVVGGTLLVLIAIGAGLYWNYASKRESTDDAQIDGHIHAVSPRVSGTVTKLLVKDNQFVEAGAVLFELDASDYQVALDRAKADLAEAEAKSHADRTEVPIVSVTSTNQLSGAEAGVGEAKASIASVEKQVDAAQARLVTAQAMARQAQANSGRAARDLERYQALLAKDEVSQQQFDATRATAEASKAQSDASEAQVNEARQGIRVAQSQLDQQRARLAMAEANAGAARSGPERVAATKARADSSAARILQMRSAVELAELNISRTVVRAPVSGIVSQRSVEVGQIVQAGQPLLAVVPLEDVWVTANFKENQMAKIRPGQRVSIKVDAYGGRTFHGHIDSIAAGTGARFSLLPPENATGNYVKVVQRVPVKIVFDKGEDSEHLLRPGLSVEPTVLTN